MSGSSRPRLRSEISRGHSHDDPMEGTSARTRPLSYGEIMRRRKSKKAIDGEEGHVTEHAGNEESVKNLDHRNIDAIATASKYSEDHAQEGGSRNMEEKSSRLEDTRNKSRNKESHDSQSKHKYEKAVTNGMEVVKPYNRGHVSGNLDDDDQDMDSRSKHRHDKNVKNGPEVSKSDRGGHVSGRIDEDNRGMRPTSKDKHENSVKNISPLKGDRRVNVQHKMDDENRDRDSRSKDEHRNYVKNDPQVSKTEGRGSRCGRIVEESHDMDSRSDRRGNVSSRIDEDNRDMRPAPKGKHENSVKNISPLKGDRRVNAIHKLDDENRDRDSRSKYEHRNMNDPQVSKTEGRGPQSARIVEESRDMDSRSDRKGHVSSRIGEDNRDMRPASKDKRENSVKNISPLKGDRRMNYDENRDRDSRSKYEHRNYVKNDPQVSKIEGQGPRSGRGVEESRDIDSRSRHDNRNYVKNDALISKTDGRDYRSGRITEEGRDMDSRSRYDHGNHVKNDAQMSKTDGRGDRSGRIVEEGRDMDSKSKHDHKNYVKNDTQVSKTDERGYRSGKAVQESHDTDSRSKHDHKNYVKNDTQVSKTDERGYRSGKAVEESRDKRDGYEDKHDKTVKNSTPSLKDDRRGNVRDKTDSKSHEVDSRSKNKHEKDRRNSTEDLKNSRQVHVTSRQGETSRDTAKYDDNDRHQRDSVAQNRYSERSRGESENEKKRKDRSIDDEKYRPRDSVKKHDTGHTVSSDISEKGKTESSHLRGNESRSKRRRSRSQEPSKSKDRRSRSASPKAQKSRVHEHGHLSSLSEKESSRPKNDVDRSNTESNGITGHHRQHNGFPGGLGGYSPRKRKTDAAITTPSPIHSPERRSAWDPPQPASQNMLSNKMDLSIGAALASNMGMPLSTTFFHGLSTFKDASVDSVQLTQATRPMRRLYIDNIPVSASEKEIMESFNNHLLYSGSNHIRGTRPCISCMINKEKGQALLEFLTPEDASAALSFDGRSLYGSMLKIRRPKDYVEMTSGSAGKSKAGAGKNNAISDVAVPSDAVKEAAICDTVKDSPHKIFVGGVAEGLSSQMIMEIFSVFGPLKAFRFNNKNPSEPCVFLEYADQSITSKACAALNGMKLGGKILTVALAIPEAAFKENLDTEPFYGIPEHVKTLLEKPTLVLKLSNVLDQKAIESLPESDLEEILEDVRLECSRFGSVLSINAVTTSNIHSTDSNSEAINEKRPREESEANDHHLNKDLVQDAMGNDADPLTNAEQLVLSESRIQVEASGIDTKEADMAASNSEIPNDSDGNKEKPVVEGIVESSITDPIEDLGNSKLDDSETSHDVEPHDIVSVSNDDSPNKNQETNVSAADNKNIFEVGSILVEFKRTEASCMAAHCLHGHLFDDRIVTVEYFPHEAYVAKFPE